MGNLPGIRELINHISRLSDNDRIEAINQVRLALHEISPMKNEPIDCVLWVKADSVQANDYNPNVVAPPEMKLLTHSIEADGYTQPIVTCQQNDHYEVVDGFHRNLVGKKQKTVKARIMGYLPITVIRTDRQDRNDRIASTIRHNRARGQHQVKDMSEIVVELARRNWTDEKIGRELGMEPDEVLRLKQISGLAEMFADKEFSQAWEII